MKTILILAKNLKTTSTDMILPKADHGNIQINYRGCFISKSKFREDKVGNALGQV